VFSQSGILARVLYTTGIIEDYSNFPIMTNDKNGIGIILTYIWKAAPFVVLMGYPILIRIHKEWKEAALLLGASETGFFFDIVLPALFPSLISSWFIIFGFSFASFEVPYLLGITYPKALPVLCFEIFSNRSLSERPQAMALGVIITVITAVIGSSAFYIYQRSSYANVKGWE
jgi:putative spermidine/putrescine transport system permease protein